MAITVEQIYREALVLSPVERADLIEKLFISFDRSPDPAIDKAWAGEVDDRFAAYGRGEIKASSADEVFARINKQ